MYAYADPVADAQHMALFPAAVPRQLPQAPDGRGRRTLCKPIRPRRPNRPEHSHRAQPAAGGPHFEEQMMHGKIFCGGQIEAQCPHTETEAQKYIGEGCSNGIGQARQGFDPCRAVSFCGGI